MIIHETKTDGTVYDIAIFQNKNGKFQFVNLTKETISPCEFNSYEEAFTDLLKYIREGKIKSLEFSLSKKIKTKR